MSFLDIVRAPHLCPEAAAEFYAARLPLPDNSHAAYMDLFTQRGQGRATLVHPSPENEFLSTTNNSSMLCFFLPVTSASSSARQPVPAVPVPQPTETPTRARSWRSPRRHNTAPTPASVAAPAAALHSSAPLHPRTLASQRRRRWQQLLPDHASNQTAESGSADLVESLESADVVFSVDSVRWSDGRFASRQACQQWWESSDTLDVLAHLAASALLTQDEKVIASVHVPPKTSKRPAFKAKSDGNEVILSAQLSSSTYADEAVITPTPLRRTSRQAKAHVSAAARTVDLTVRKRRRTTAF
jgi:hypothetical protein